MDPDLSSKSAPLTAHAHRVVLELTERASLKQVDELFDRIRALRALGYRIAVDDLGAGYAGLSTFSQVEPDLVKLDMSLVRDIDASGRKASLVRSMLTVCQRELGVLVVCEGVETEQERDTLLGLGASLFQGYLFGRPDRHFRSTGLFSPVSSMRPL
jgi:EAL domain-containing protein (putative c-di-GMP-specific phosphodiesterase class I)